MNTFFQRGLGVALWLGVICCAQARLNIEITQGMVGGVPIAVTSAATNGQQAFDDLSEVIRGDLRMCGRFAPLSQSQLPQSLTTHQEMNFAMWQELGAENVLLGSLESTGGDFFKVKVKLLDVYTGQQAAKRVTLQDGEIRLQGQRAILFNKTFTGIRRQDFRALAHHISDIVYEKLTGTRGAFSTRIAYVMVTQNRNEARYRLEVADADGFNPITLMESKEPIMSPSWSPDGRRLAFVSFEKNRAEIYLIDVVSGKRELLSKFSGINGAPAWSPDGQHLALVLSKSGSPKLYLMDLTTKALSPLTKGYSIDTEPTFSPDGQSIYFTSNRGGKPQIYRLDLASKETTRITFVGGYNARPMLSADGKYLIMMHRQEYGDPFHIASQELSTGQVSVLTRAPFNESPTLSPNGAMVMYGTQVGDRHILGLVTLDGRGHLRLPAREGSVQEPAWSPFLS